MRNLSRPASRYSAPCWQTRAFWSQSFTQFQACGGPVCKPKGLVRPRTDERVARFGLEQETRVSFCRQCKIHVRATEVQLRQTEARWKGSRQDTDGRDR